MNKIKLYRIESNIPNEARKIENDNFINEINMYLTEDNIELSEEIETSYLNAVLVESGGSEEKFLKFVDKLTSPVILLEMGKHNSLAATFEIKTYLNLNLILIFFFIELTIIFIKCLLLVNIIYDFSLLFFFL